MRREKLEGRINIDDYVKRLGEDFGTTDIDQAAKLYLQKYLTNLTEYKKMFMVTIHNYRKDYVKENMI
jgi:hypothetical protein